MSEAPNGQSQRIEIDDGPNTAHGVDWAALWDEFGFGNGDVDGNHWVSRTQLEAAIECSEQDINRESSAIVNAAADAAYIGEVTSPCGSTRGFVLVGGEQ